MHGKGGSPAKFVDGLARTLERRGYLVANIEMPWSGNRSYDAGVSRAEEEVEAACASLRAGGAKKVFVAGHSMGGVFALHLAGRLAVDGIVAIAPGGSSSSPVIREKLAGSLERARQLVAQGKGSEPAWLEDYEGSRGVYRISAVPAAYVTWMDPDGAMSMTRAAQAADPKVPILWIVPKRDYPGLLKTTPAIFRTLPPNPLTRFHEPESDHLNAPAASAEEIVRWTKEVAGAAPR
ncbi:MAG TPA: alpha/beta fold hydrolase [Burkholderiales bacterium]|nr:alpha/beta fold hydrolase [Burkholderiales bacterium]